MQTQIPRVSSFRFRNSLILAILFAAVFFACSSSALAAGPVQAADSDNPFLWMIVYTSMALIFSFLCSVAEAVMLSISPSYLAKLEGEKHRAAKLLKNMKHNIDRSLAAILTLNTIAHTVGAGGAGAQAAAYFGPESVNIVMIVLTLLILFLSEIIPKTLGAVYWRSLAPITGRFVWLLCIVLFPLIYVSELLTKFMTRGKSVHGFNREEFTALASIGAEGGHFNEHESSILTNLFRLHELRVEDIMTPRTVVYALQQDATVHDVFTAQPELTFSRIPLYGENKDDVTGFVLKSDILLKEAKDEGKCKLRDLRRDLNIIHAGSSLSNAFDKLFDQRAHALLVVDQHGGMQGLVTLEDVVETLIGIEIVDEADKDVDMRVVARTRWRERMKRLGVDVDLDKNVDETET